MCLKIEITDFFLRNKKLSNNFHFLIVFFNNLLIIFLSNKKNTGIISICQTTFVKGKKFLKIMILIWQFQFFFIIFYNYRFCNNNNNDSKIYPVLVYSFPNRHILENWSNLKLALIFRVNDCRNPTKIPYKSFCKANVKHLQTLLGNKLVEELGTQNRKPVCSIRNRLIPWGKHKISFN